MHHHSLLLLLVLLLLTASVCEQMLQGMLWQHMVPLAESVCLRPTCFATALAMQRHRGALAPDLLLW